MEFCHNNKLYHTSNTQFNTNILKTIKYHCGQIVSIIFANWDFHAVNLKNVNYKFYVNITFFYIKKMSFFF